MHEKLIIITPTLSCFEVTPVPSDVSFLLLDAVAPPAGRVVVGAPLLALLLHAAATTTSPTTAARQERRAASAKLLSGSLPSVSSRCSGTE
jgi:hypothetical protein